MLNALKTVVGIGEVLWDMLPNGKQLGGAPINFAYHVTQLGLRGIAVSAVGNDSLGDEIIACLNAHSIENIIERINFPTGIVNVTIDSSGIPQYDICQDVAWDKISFSPQLTRLALDADAVCFGTLGQRNAVSRVAIRKFVEMLPDNCLRICDINIRQSYYTHEIIEWSLRHCDILKVNNDELDLLKSILGLPDDNNMACISILHKYNLKVVILTLGEYGSWIYSANEKSYEPTPEVNVIDTVGAGDSFTAAFVVSYLNGKSIKESHRHAVAVSAQTCTHPGAMR